MTTTGTGSMKVRLRAMEPEDLDMLYKIENDVKLWNVGVTNVPYSRYTLHNYIADNKNDIYVDKQLRLMIEDDEKHVVGIIDLINFDPRHQRAELGIVIANHFRKQGYASSAIRIMIDYSRNVLHLHQLYVFIDAGNKASIALFESLGFKKGASLRDWLLCNDEYRDALFMQYIM